MFNVHSNGAYGSSSGKNALYNNHISLILSWTWSTICRTCTCPCIWRNARVYWHATSSLLTALASSPFVCTDPLTFQSFHCVTCQLFPVCNVTLHVHTCSGRNRIIPLMRRPNTDSTPNKPVTLPRNQLLIRYAVTSPVHTVTIWCYDTR
jgi:hypothetical protein